MRVHFKCENSPGPKPNHERDVVVKNDVAQGLFVEMFMQGDMAPAGSTIVVTRPILVKAPGSPDQVNYIRTWTLLDPEEVPT